MWLLKCDFYRRYAMDEDDRRRGHDAGCQICEAANGDLRIGGHSRTSGAGDFDMWLELTNSNGDGLHSAFYGPVETRERCTAMVGATTEFSWADTR